MEIDEVLSGRSSPVPEQPWLNLFRFQRLSQQGIFKEIDLADAQIIRSAPVAVHLVEHRRRERTLRGCGCRLTFAVSCDCGRQIHVEDKFSRLAGLVQILTQWFCADILINVNRLFFRGHTDCSSPLSTVPEEPGRGLRIYDWFAF